MLYDSGMVSFSNNISTKKNFDRYVAVIMPVKWNRDGMLQECVKVIFIHTFNKLKIKQMKTH